MLLSFPFLVFWAFLGLKLSGAWQSVSWVWVTAPLWFTALLWLIALVSVTIGAAVADRSARKLSEKIDLFHRDWL